MQRGIQEAKTTLETKDKSESITTAKFSLNGWGTTPSFTVTGKDQCYVITITVTAGSFAGPTFTHTFADGAFPNASVWVAQLVGGTGVTSAQLLNTSSTTTTATWTWQGTPGGVGTTYVFNVVGLGY